MSDGVAGTRVEPHHGAEVTGKSGCFYSRWTLCVFCQILNLKKGYKLYKWPIELYANLVSHWDVQRFLIDQHDQHLPDVPGTSHGIRVTESNQHPSSWSIPGPFVPVHATTIHHQWEVAHHGDRQNSFNFGIPSNFHRSVIVQIGDIPKIRLCIWVTSFLPNISLSLVAVAKIPTLYWVHNMS